MNAIPGPIPYYIAGLVFAICALTRENGSPMFMFDLAMTWVLFVAGDWRADVVRREEKA